MVIFYSHKLEEKTLLYQDAQGNENSMKYDILVVEHENQ